MKLTAAEIEEIKIKREKAELEQREKAIEEQLKYDGYLRQQSKYFQDEIQRLTDDSERMRSAYNTLVELGVGDYISIGIREKKIEVSYLKDTLKPEDYIVKNHPYNILSTKWGDIYSIESNMKMQLPSQLSSRYQAYKLETAASKIKDKVAEELRIKNEIDIKNKYITELIDGFKSQFPKGTTFEKGTTYRRNYNGKGGYNVDTLRIEYPNKSWVLIQYGTTSWTILEKFDSKYIKPETKEDWLIYLSK